MKDGKVRAIGASNYSGPRLSQALEVSKKHRLPAYQTLQPEYNLYDRADYQKNLEGICVANGLGVISYFSLASGFLTGKCRSEADLSKSQRGGRVKKYLNERGFRILKALDKVAAQYNSTPARAALAWLIARPGITAPIASATNLEQLKDLIEATKLQLDRTSIETLNRASAE
jgi:aryl-alcohol dehydrogenase-like predicted oxidoreductase